MNTIKTFLDENYIGNLGLPQLMHTLDIYFSETDYNIVTLIVAYCMFDKKVHNLYNSKDNLDIVRFLVDIKKVDMRGYNEYVFRWAARRGHLDMVKYLVETHKVDVHAYNDRVLGYAARHGHLNVVIYLADHNVNVHAYDECALIWAASNGHLDIVKYLVETCNADIHAINDSALRWVASNGHRDVVDYIENMRSILNAERTCRI